MNILKLWLEPYALKGASTVLRGGKFVKTYLSQRNKRLNYICKLNKQNENEKSKYN